MWTAEAWRGNYLPTRMAVRLVYARARVRTDKSAASQFWAVSSQQRDWGKVATATATTTWWWWWCAKRFLYGNVPMGTAGIELAIATFGMSQIYDLYTGYAMLNRIRKSFNISIHRTLTRCALCFLILKFWLASLVFSQNISKLYWAFVFRVGSCTIWAT